MKSKPEVTTTLVLPSAASGSRDGSETDVARNAERVEQTGSTDTEKDPATAVEARVADPSPGVVVAPPRNNAVALSIAIGVVGLGFGVFGTGAILGWWTSEDEAPELGAVDEISAPQYTAPAFTIELLASSPSMPTALLSSP